MKKLLIILSALVVLALVAVFGAIPFYVGTQVEKALAGKSYHFKDYDLALVVTSVKGGVRSSAVEFDLKLYNPQAAALAPNPARDEKGLYLTLKGKGVIHHGPVAFGWPIITPFVAGGEAGLWFPENIDPDFKRLMQHFFGDQPPLSVLGRMGMDGTIQIRLTVPDYNGPLPQNAPGSLQWGGLNVWLDVEQGGQRYSMGGEAPVIKITAPKAEFLATNIQFSGTSEKASAYLWLGDGTFSIGSLAGKVGKEKFNLENFAYTAGLSEKDGNLEIALKLAVEKGGGKEFSIKPSALDIKLKSINRSVFEDLLKKIQELKNSVTDPSRLPVMIFLTLPQYGLKFLENPPQLELTGLTVDTNHGKLRIEGAIEPAWMDPSRRQNLANMVAGSKARLSLRLSKSLVEEVLGRQLRKNLRARAKYQGRTLNKTQEEKLIKNAIQQQIGAVLQQKYIVEQGEEYTSDWTLDKGVLKNNGQDRTALLRMMLGR